MPALHADMLGGAEKVQAERTEFEEIAESVDQAIGTLLSTGMSENDVLQVLCSTEPLTHHKESVRALIAGREGN